MFVPNTILLLFFRSGESNLLHCLSAYTAKMFIALKFRLVDLPIIKHY